MAAIQLAASYGEPYFSRCCALKRTRTFASESKVTCLFKLNLRSDDFMFHS